MTNQELHDQEHRSSTEIESDIRQTRGRMDATLDELGDRLSARSLLNSALDWWESRGVGARSGQQEDSRRRHRAADDQQQLHLAPCGSRLSTGAGSCRGRTVKRFQTDSSCNSRLVRALSWKGLGSMLASRRRRTAAS